MTKEELMELGKNTVVKCATEKENQDFIDAILKTGWRCCGETQKIPNHGVIYRSLACEYKKNQAEWAFTRGFYEEQGKEVISAKEFLSWFDKTPKRKVGRPTKPKKLDKIIANLKAVREDADKSEDRQLFCRLDGVVLCKAIDKEYYYYKLPHTREQAIAVSRFILDLEK